MKARRVRWLGFVLMVGLAGGALAAPAGASDAGPWLGTWVRADHEQDDVARDAEIERVTAPMAFVFRGFARALMRRAMVPPERYEIELGEEAPLLRSDGDVVYVLDGQRHTGGEDEEVTSTLDASGEIRQVWRHGEASHGTSVWRLAPSGDRATVTETIHDPHFDEPIRYTTTYRRLGGAP